MTSIMCKIERHILTQCIEEAVHDWPDRFIDIAAKTQLIHELTTRGVLDFSTQALCVGLLDLTTEALEHLVNEGVALVGRPLRLAPYTAETQCHASTALNWLLNQKLHIYTGIGDRFNPHSWLVNPETNGVIEPTPIFRAYYFGYRVEDPFEFARSFESEISVLSDPSIPLTTILRARSILQSHFQPTGAS